MQNLKVGIILGSTRQGRKSEDVGNWVYGLTKDTPGLDVEIVDIREFDLPFLGTTSDTTNVDNWKAKLNELDAFIFVVAEYNHSITGALKNALDSARDEWNNKAAGIISYGSAGGARAAEHLRGILAELQVPSVRSHILLSLFDDFEKFSRFTPRNIHDDNVTILINQLSAWAAALKPLRSK